MIEHRNEKTLLSIRFCPLRCVIKVGVSEVKSCMGLLANIVYNIESDNWPIASLL